MPAKTSTYSAEQSLLAVLDIERGGSPCGVAFIVAPNLALTCAHVVEGASNEARSSGTGGRAKEVLVSSLLATKAGEVLLAEVEYPAEGGSENLDLVLLRLEREPSGTQPVQLVSSYDPWGSQVRAFGFPRSRDSGVWHSGILRGRQADGLIQIDSETGIGYQIEPGFSGSPIYEHTGLAVLGMVVAADQVKARAGFVIPSDAILDAFPVLDQTGRCEPPYRGLRPFDEQHQTLFFGRDAAIEDLAVTVRRSQFLTVVGASGAGKSSIVQAGLIPALRKQEFAALTLKPNDASTPLAALAGEIVAKTDPDLPIADQIATQRKLTRAIGRDGLHDYVPQLLQKLEAKKLLVVIDQAEQFLFCNDSAVESFLAAVAPDVRIPHIHLVLTLRADFLNEMIGKSTIGRVLQAGIWLVPAMTMSEIKSAIEDPIRPHIGTKFETGLVERLLDDARGEPGALPFLGKALEQLWEKQSRGVLSHSSYDAIGGLLGSIVTHAEDTWGDLSEPDQAATKRLLLKMANFDERARITKRQIRASVIHGDELQVAGKLVDARLLVATDDSEKHAVFEVAHESLLMHWPRFREWTESDLEFLQWNQQISTSITSWKATGMDTGGLLRGTNLAIATSWVEHRSNEMPKPIVEFVRASSRLMHREARRFRNLTVGLCILLVVALASLSTVLYQNSQLDVQLASARAETLSREASARALSDPSFAARLALAAWQTSSSSPGALSALSRAYASMYGVNREIVHINEAAISSFQASVDGRTMLLNLIDGTWQIATTTDDGGTSLWSPPGLTENSNPLLSPDGTLLVAIDLSGLLQTWEVGEQSQPRVLRQASQEQGYIDSSRISFASNSESVIEIDQRTQVIKAIWQLRQGVGEIGGLAGIQNIEEAWLTPVEGVVAIRRSGSDAILLVSAVTGESLEEFPEATFVAANGSLLVSCLPVEGMSPFRNVRTIDLSTNRVVADFRVGEDAGCLDETSGGARTTADGEYLVQESDDGDEPSTLKSIIFTSLRTGSRFDALLPASAGDPRRGDLWGGTGRYWLEVLPPGSVDRVPASMASVGNSLLQFNIDVNPLVLGETATYGRPRVLRSDNGQYSIAVGSADLRTFDRMSGARIADFDLVEEDAALRGFGPEVLVDGDEIVAIERPEDGGLIVTRVSLPMLQLISSVQLQGTTVADGTSWAAAIVDGRIAVAVSNTVGFFDGVTGSLIEQRVTLDEIDANSIRVLQGRPGHESQIGVIADDSFLVVDLAVGEVIRQIPVEPAEASFGRAVFDQSGANVAITTPDNAIQLWNIESGLEVRPEMQAASYVSLIGFSSDGQLVLTASQDGVEAYQLWDLELGEIGGEMLTSFSAFSAAEELRPALSNTDELSLVGWNRNGILLALDSDVWFEQVCGTLGGTFSEQERLVAGVDTDFVSNC